MSPPRTPGFFASFDTFRSFIFPVVLLAELACVSSPRDCVSICLFDINQAECEKACDAIEASPDSRGADNASGGPALDRGLPLPPAPDRGLPAPPSRPPQSLEDPSVNQFPCNVASKCLDDALIDPFGNGPLHDRAGAMSEENLEAELPDRPVPLRPPRPPARRMEKKNRSNREAENKFTPPAPGVP